MENSKIIRKNRNGISVVVCCASCRHCKLDKRARLCLKGEGIVPPSYLCSDWERRDVYDIVGNGDGTIKKARYLRYALEEMEKDDNAYLLASMRNERYVRKSITEIRHEYETKFGNIYEIEK